MRKGVIAIVVLVGLYLASSLLPCSAYELLPFRRPIGGGCSGNIGNDDADTDKTGIGNFLVNLRKTNFACTGTAVGVHTMVDDAASATREIIQCIYNDDGGSGTPGTLHSNGSAISGSDFTFLSDAGYTPTISTEGDYWIGFVMENTATEAVYDNANPLPTDNSFTFTHTSFACPADLSGLGTFNVRNYTFYVEF
jgi:hypothetical protein